MAEIEKIDGKNWKEFVEAPLAVLMLGKSDCKACNDWTEELNGFLAEDSEFGDVRFGKMLLDTPGLVSFKRANPWVAEVDALPTNIIFKEGENVKLWAGGGADRMANRLRRQLG